MGCVPDDVIRIPIWEASLVCSPPAQQADSAAPSMQADKKDGQKHMISLCLSKLASRAC